MMNKILCIADNYKPECGKYVYIACENNLILYFTLKFLKLLKSYNIQYYF